jgi:hypothetical protein
VKLKLTQTPVELEAWAELGQYTFRGEEQQLLIWKSSSRLSGGAAAAYLIQVNIKLTQPQVEIEIYSACSWP